MKLDFFILHPSSFILFPVMAPEPSVRPASAAGGILRSLHHRNFRLFFIGQGISLIGTWMQQVAMGWLVYEMSTRVTHAAVTQEKNAEAAFRLGLVTFASQIPSFLLIPFVGEIGRAHV